MYALVLYFLVDFGGNWREHVDCIQNTFRACVSEHADETSGPWNAV